MNQANFYVVALVTHGESHKWRTLTGWTDDPIAAEVFITYAKAAHEIWALPKPSIGTRYEAVPIDWFLDFYKDKQ